MTELQIASPKRQERDCRSKQIAPSSLDLLISLKHIAWSKLSGVCNRTAQFFWQPACSHSSSLMSASIPVAINRLSLFLQISNTLFRLSACARNCSSMISFRLVPSAIQQTDWHVRLPRLGNRGGEHVQSLGDCISQGWYQSHVAS